MNRKEEQKDSDDLSQEEKGEERKRQKVRRKSIKKQECRTQKKRTQLLSGLWAAISASGETATYAHSAINNFNFRVTSTITKVRPSRFVPIP